MVVSGVAEVYTEEEDELSYSSYEMLSLETPNMSIVVGEPRVSRWTGKDIPVEGW